MSEIHKNFEAELVSQLSSIKSNLASVDAKDHQQILNLKKELVKAEKTLKLMEAETALVSIPSEYKNSTFEYRKTWDSAMKSIKDLEQQFYEQISRENARTSSGGNQDSKINDIYLSLTHSIRNNRTRDLIVFAFLAILLLFLLGALISLIYMI